MIDSFRRLLDQPFRTDEPKLCFLENQGRRETGFAFPDGRRLAHFEYTLRPIGTDLWSVLLDSIRTIPSAGRRRVVPAQPQNPSRVFSGWPVEYTFFK